MRQGCLYSSKNSNRSSNSTCTAPAMRIMPGASSSFSPTACATSSASPSALAAAAAAQVSDGGGGGGGGGPACPAEEHANSQQHQGVREQKYEPEECSTEHEYQIGQKKKRFVGYAVLAALVIVAVVAASSVVSNRDSSNAVGHIIRRQERLLLSSINGGAGSGGREDDDASFSTTATATTTTTTSGTESGRVVLRRRRQQQQLSAEGSATGITATTPPPPDAEHRRQAHQDIDDIGNIFDPTTTALAARSSSAVVVVGQQQQLQQQQQQQQEVDADKELKKLRRYMKKFKRATSGRNYRYRYVQFDSDGVKLDTRNVIVRNGRAGDANGRSDETLPTILDLLSQIRTFVQTVDDFSYYEVNYNPKLGYPREIRIDFRDDDSGDEVSMFVRTGKLKLLGQSNNNGGGNGGGGGNIGGNNGNGNGNGINNRQQDCSAVPFTVHRGLFDRFLRRNNKPTRSYKIYTPDRYSSATPSAVVVMLHGWSQGGVCDGDRFLTDDWKRVADTHNYVLVAPDGLEEGDGDEFPKSWSIPGSRNGRGQNGDVTSCDRNKSGAPNHCFPSCNGCGGNRCGWAQCLDDDVQFFVDLVADLRNYICMNPDRLYVYGYSAGGMMAWTLGQDRRSAPLLAGIGAIQGLPMWDYLLGKGVPNGRKLPVIGIYGSRDCSVPPGDGRDQFNEVCDGDGYYYVDAWHQHRLWAQDHSCPVTTAKPEARFGYNISGRNEVRCSSHCNPSSGPPASVDCRSNDDHGKEPWHLDAALKFFDDHARADGLL